MSDLFDEPPLHAPAARATHVGAIATISPAHDPDDLDGYVALRWRAAGIGLVAAAGAGFLFRFPIWAVAALALFVAGVNLWRLPKPATRAWVIVALSFFFAQATSIFVLPFTWPMRFGFCAVLLTGLALARAE